MTTWVTGFLSGHSAPDTTWRQQAVQFQRADDTHVLVKCDL